MALLKFLRRPGTAMDAASAGGTTATGVAGSSAALAVQAARDQARRRLLGAAVLLGIGIIGFPLVFQTQPRPLPRKKGGTESSTLAVHSTRVSPNSINTEPSAWRVK